MTIIAITPGRFEQFSSRFGASVGTETSVGAGRHVQSEGNKSDHIGVGVPQTIGPRGRLTMARHSGGVGPAVSVDPLDTEQAQLTSTNTPPMSAEDY